MDSHDADRELLNKVVDAIDKKNVFRAVLLNDSFDDWNLVRELGGFLVRIMGESEILGHALLLRAYRHLGQREPAISELNACRAIDMNQLTAYDQRLFVPLLETESQFLAE